MKRVYRCLAHRWRSCFWTNYKMFCYCIKQIVFILPFVRSVIVQILVTLPIVINMTTRKLVADDTKDSLFSTVKNLIRHKMVSLSCFRNLPTARYCFPSAFWTKNTCMHMIMIFCFIRLHLTKQHSSLHKYKLFYPLHCSKRKWRKDR